MHPFDPYSIVGQYGFDLAGYLLCRHEPQTIYLQTIDPEIARVVARRLIGFSGELLVDREDVAQLIQTNYRIGTSIYRQTTVDAAIIPFSRKQRQQPPCAKQIVVIAENSLSYRSLMRPGGVSDSLFSVHKWVRQTHRMQETWGLFDPLFLWRTAISQLAGHRIPTLHFRSGQRALDNIYVTGIRAALSYIVVVTGVSLQSRD